MPMYERGRLREVKATIAETMRLRNGSWDARGNRGLERCGVAEIAADVGILCTIVGLNPIFVQP